MEDISVPTVSLWEALKRRWITALLTFSVVAGAGTFVIWRMARTYTTSAILLVRTEHKESQVVVDFQTLQTIERLNETIAQLAVQPSVLRRVQRIANVPHDQYQLQAKIRAAAVPRTELIRISASDSSPDLAQTLANAAALALIERVEEIETVRPSGTSLTIAEEAQRPPTPSSTPKRVQAMGTLLSSGIAAVIAARLRDLLNRRVQTERDVEQGLHLQILGKTHRFRRHTTHKIRARDSFRDLQSTLQFVPREDPVRALAVTGTMAGEGKSTTVANLALALQDVGQEVIVLDFDFRRPSLHRLFQVDNASTVNLADLLSGSQAFPPPLPTSFPRIRLYPSGSASPDQATRLYHSPRVAELARSLIGMPGNDQRWILADLPPILSVPGSIAAASAFHNTLMVLELGRPRFSQAREALELLHRARVNLLGVILTKLAHNSVLSRYYGDGYGYYKEKDDRKGRTAA